MMSLATIHALEDEAARRAARKHLRPYVIWDANEIESYPPFPFPNLGSHRDRGWELVSEWICDSSGFGASDEPALTVERLKNELRITQAEHPRYGYGIISEGQFQIILGVFEEQDG